MTSYQLFYGRFFRVIYGCLETAPIWISETHMRFFRAIYWSLETTSGIYCHFQMTSYQLFYGRFLELYMVVWKRLLYGLVKHICVFLEPYIGVWRRLQPYIVISK